MTTRRDSESPPAASIRFAARADVGGREIQEDALVADPGLGVFAVADAMGAGASGRHAADLALETLCEALRRPSSGTAEERLSAAARAAHAALFARTDGAARAWQRRVEDPRSAVDRDVLRWHGVGTTIVALLFARSEQGVEASGLSPRPADGDRAESATRSLPIPLGAVHAAIAHCGDSRAYRLRAWTLEPLTVDHRLRDDARGAGLSEDEIAKLPAGVITAALGFRAEPRIDVARVDVEPGDLFLLCSDGLSDAAPAEEIERILVSHLNDLDGAARALVARAASEVRESSINPGVGDNVTVVLVRPLP